MSTKCMKEFLEQDRCCCNCKHHIRDYRHCSTDRKEGEECVCNEPKGWICMPPDFPGHGYSGWPEHGLCEMHDYRLERV
jgi:hypothetical protein